MPVLLPGDFVPSVAFQESVVCVCSNLVEDLASDACGIYTTLYVPALRSLVVELPLL